MRILWICLVLSFLLSVWGHAVLKTPSAWNLNPSKASPCGGGPQPTDTTTTWNVGTNVSIIWQVVAGDGVGTVTLIIDPSGGTNYQAASGIVLGNPQAVGVFPFSFIVPSVTCTGTGNLCTVQVASSSAWFSCTTVRIEAAGIPPPPPPPVICQVATGLQFCTMINAHNISLQPGTNAISLDTALSTTYTSTLFNPNVFSTPNTTSCQTSYKNYLCHSQFPYCGQTTACQPSCYDAIGNCGITTSHRGLYNCAQGPISCTDPNSSSTIILSMVVILAALILTML